MYGVILDGKGKKRSGGTSSKLEEEDVDELFKILTDKHGDIITVYHSEDCGLKLSTVGPMIVSILHLLFQWALPFNEHTPPMDDY